MRVSEYMTMAQLARLPLGEALAGFISGAPALALSCLKDGFVQVQKLL